MVETDWQDQINRLQQRERKARAVLGVSENADLMEIRRAFRRACIVHHPDVNRGETKAADRFLLICCAYKFLTEGENCEALDRLDVPPKGTAEGEYRMDNPWGYWCWWREKYF